MVDIVYHVCKSHFTSQFLPRWLDFTFFDVIGVENASEWWDLGYAAARNECATTTLPVELCLWSPWNIATNIIYVVSSRRMRLCDYCWYHVLCIGTLLFIFSLGAQLCWATLHCGQGPWPQNCEALETHPKAILWKLRLNFVWPRTFKFSVRRTTGLSTKCYFVTIFFMWDLLHNKL